MKEEIYKSPISYSVGIYADIITAARNVPLPKFTFRL